MSIFDKIFNAKYKYANDYFQNIKNNLSNINEEQLNKIIKFCGDQMIKAKNTQQHSLETRFKDKMYEVSKELIAMQKGFVKYIEASAIQDIVKVKEKPIRVVRQEDYEREIPDEVIDILKAAKELKCTLDGEEKKLFESFYIVYTDLSSMSSEKAKKAYEQSKDPILFGCVVDSAEMRKSHDDNSSKSSVKMFFLADWTDDYCDLTFDELLDIASKNNIKGISASEDDIDPKENIKKAIQEIIK